MITYSPSLTVRTTPVNCTGVFVRPMPSSDTLLPSATVTSAPSPAETSAATASGSHSGPTPMPSRPCASASCSTSIVSQLPPDMQLSPWSSSSTGRVAPPAMSFARATDSASGSLR
ncbi:hypothetical protein D9M69_650490 [compost metagenome]